MRNLKKSWLLITIPILMVSIFFVTIFIPIVFFDAPINSDSNEYKLDKTPKSINFETKKIYYHIKKQMGTLNIKIWIQYFI